MAKRACSQHGCGTLVEVGQGRCDDCKHEAEARRGTPAQRGYDSVHRLLFRDAVLARDPICKACLKHWSTVADHYPLSRRELVEVGLDPNDPQYGRGLCKGCHDKHTAQAQPGGWNAR